MLPVSLHRPFARLPVVALLLLLSAIMTRDIPADSNFQFVAAAAVSHLVPDCDDRDKAGGTACCGDIHCMTQSAAVPGGMGQFYPVSQILPAPLRELAVAAANCAYSTFEPPRIAA